jgi:hypothetical protein
MTRGKDTRDIYNRLGEIQVLSIEKRICADASRVASDEEKIALGSWIEAERHADLGLEHANAGRLVEAEAEYELAVEACARAEKILAPKEKP